MRLELEVGATKAKVVRDERSARVFPAGHQHNTLKSTVWNLLNEPSSSNAAQGIAALVMAMIVLSTIAFIVQTLPQYVMSSNPGFDAVEVLCVTVFTIEFVLRLASTPNCRSFMTSALGRRGERCDSIRYAPRFPKQVP